MADLDTSKPRRRFVRWLFGGAAAGLAASVVYPVIRFVSPPEVPESTTNQVEAGPTNDPAFLEKGFKMVRFGSEPVIVVRVAEDDFRAFAATCTHLDCIVEYRQDKQLLWCWCHNGMFDLQGRNVGGPPPKPLESYTVHLVGDTMPQTIVVEKT